MKKFDAIVWPEDVSQAGERIEIMAEDLADAKSKLEAEYGKGRVYTLKNDEDARKVR